MRYIPITASDREAMLGDIGVASTRELFADIPAAARPQAPPRIDGPLAEAEILNRLQAYAAENVSTADRPCFLGAGAYDHYIPSVVDHILRRGDFFTAYTPYQPEVSQGTLQVIYEFQTMVCELLGMDLANASMYDGASALAEACIMALRHTGRSRLVLPESIHPDYRRTVATYVAGLGAEVVTLPCPAGAAPVAALEAAAAGAAAVVVQHPNFFGCLEAAVEIGAIARRAGALYIAAVDPISLGLLAPPGAYGADIAVAEGQPLGVPLSFGGPYLGLLAVRAELARRIPGRIVGATVDAQGRRGFTLTLQTREQHIRREKATSNICTNQALLALAATVYLTWVGKEGLKAVAHQCLQKTHYALQMLSAAGFAPAFSAPVFKEFTVRSPVDPLVLEQKLLQRGYIGGYPLVRSYAGRANLMVFAVTEKRTKKEIDGLAAQMVAIAREGDTA